MVCTWVDYLLEGASPCASASCIFPNLSCSLSSNFSYNASINFDCVLFTVSRNISGVQNGQKEIKQSDHLTPTSPISQARAACVYRGCLGI